MDKYYTIGKIKVRDFMTLLFDISVLGYGAIQPAFRTGVYRATQELALALMEAMSEELVFCAGDSPKAWALSYDFWKNNSLRERPFLPNATKSPLFVGAVNHLTRLNQIDKPSFPKKVLRRALREVADLRAPKHLNLLPAIAQGIYHSPFYPLLPETKKFKRVLSIYDLINLTHPEVSQGNPDFLKTVISTLSEEDHVICSSRWTAEELLEYRSDIRPEQVSTIHLGLSPHFKPASEQAITLIRTTYQLDKPYFLALSTSETRKNFPFLIRCFNNFLRSYPTAEVDLVLAGASGNSSKLIYNTIEPKYLNRIKLIGFVPEEHLPALYSGALAFVFPSLYEGFGFPPLESMGCGCPVLSSKGSSLDEVVGAGGKLLCPYTEEEWVEHLTAFYDSPTLREDWRKKGLEWVKQFSWINTAQKHRELYARIR